MKKANASADVSAPDAPAREVAAEWVPIDELHVWKDNPRKNDGAPVKKVAESIHRFGFASPIIARRNGEIIAGHTRYKAAKQLKLDRVPVRYMDLEPDAAHLLALADNRTAEEAEWDDAMLSAVLGQLESQGADLASTGFDEKELERLLRDVSADSDADGEVIEPPVDPITKPGDLWLLGNHRLLCGDSTKAEDVKRLMAGAKAGMVHTDPPYGMSYQSNMRTKSAKFAVLENDDRVLTEWIEPAIRNSEGWVFIWTTWKVLEQWFPVVKPFGKLSNLVVWSKGGGGIGDLKKTFSTDHEIAFVFNRGAELCGKRIGSVWSFGKDAAGDYEHPTQKPVALAAEAIDKTTTKACTVYDPFLGSGTTLIAAEQLGRKCYGMEISPAYCDVIVKRWETMTGQTATLESAPTAS